MTRVDGGKKFAIAAGGVVLLLLAGIVCWQLAGRAGLPVAATAPSAAPVLTTDAGPAPIGHLDFEAGSAHLPAGSLDVLNRIADAARAMAGATVEISGYYLGGADAARNAGLAKQRGQAARHALEANGVASGQIRNVISEAPAGADARSGDRIELAVR